jgi:hypothetical protein
MALREQLKSDAKQLDRSEPYISITYRGVECGIKRKEKLFYILILSFIYFYYSLYRTNMLEVNLAAWL